MTLGLVAPRHPECQGQRYGLEEGEDDPAAEELASGQGGEVEVVVEE